jgi:septal ring factor EnvC (AmiA/AmiB activator)
VTAPTGEPPLDALPPDAPATVEDVRTSRRWTIVALAWAVAASAIAVLALIQAGKDDNSTSTTTQTTQAVVSPKDFEDFQKQVNDRLDAFSRRLNDTASAADLQKLDKRLASVEDDLSEVKTDSGKSADSITQLQADVKDLQQRVDDLESQQQDQQTTP